jgi:hypothetical protein
VATLMMLGDNVFITSDGPKFGGRRGYFEAGRTFQAGTAGRRGQFLPALQKILEMITIDAAKALAGTMRSARSRRARRPTSTRQHAHPRMMPRFNPVHMISHRQASDVETCWWTAGFWWRGQVICADEMEILEAGDKTPGWSSRPRFLRTSRI